MAPSDLELIPRAVTFTLGHTEAARAEVVEALQESAATPLVTALRVMTMQQAILATGVMALFESVLQQAYGWTRTFAELDAHLRADGKADLADRFADFKNAINVLKHGQGGSYEKLLERRDSLPFAVKPKDENYFCEGDVSEVTSLVEPTVEFVEACGSIIQEVTDALRKRPDAR